MASENVRHVVLDAVNLLLVRVRDGSDGSLPLLNKLVAIVVVCSLSIRKTKNRHKRGTNAKPGGAGTDTPSIFIFGVCIGDPPRSIKSG